jgi:hypothetical protein
MVDHEYGVEHSGNTGGGETLILLNGPIVKQLGFQLSQAHCATVSCPIHP